MLLRRVLSASFHKLSICSSFKMESESTFSASYWDLDIFKSCHINYQYFSWEIFIIYLKNLSSSFGPLKSSFVSVIYSVSRFRIGIVSLNVWTLFLSAYVAKSFPVQSTTPSTSSPETLTG